MRISLLALKSDLNRNFLQVFTGKASLFDPCADALNVGLADCEVHVDRVELNDGGERSGAAGADKLTQRDVAGRHNAIERRFHLRIAKVELGLLDIDLRLLLLGDRRVLRSRCLVERRLARDVFRRKIDLAFVVGLRLFSIGCSARLPCLGLLEGELIRLLLDDEQYCPSFNGVTVFVLYVLDETLYARHQCRGVHGRSVTRRFQVARDRLLQGQGNLDLWRWRWDERVFLAAARNDQGWREDRSGD